MALLLRSLGIKGRLAALGGRAAHVLPESALLRPFHASAWLFDYYSTLGVSRDASENDIKKKYYQLAKKFHPDTNQGDPEAAKKFQEVQRAYDTLRDPQKRQAYDSMGHSAFENMEATGGAPGDGQGPFSGGMQVDPEDLFREFFGGGRGRGGQTGFEGTIFEHMFGGGFGGQSAGFGGQRMRARPMLRTAMRISFEDAVKGSTKQVDLSSLGIRGMPRKTVEIQIPPGSDSGFQLRLQGVVPAGQGLPPGDIIVMLQVAPSPTFEREDHDLYVNVAVDMVDAALGASVDVPTIDGMAEVKIKPGTQPGDKLRMRGYGVRMDAVGQPGRRGDQYVRVQVRVPRHLTAEQRRLLEELRSGKSSSSSSSSSSSGGSGSGSGGGGGGGGGAGRGKSSSGSSGTASSGSTGPSSDPSSAPSSSGDAGSSNGAGSSSSQERESQKKRRSWKSFFSRSDEGSSP